MEKERLNNEIVLCRPCVRRARVCIIRKKIKKMKILRSCKKDEERGKKLKKADRLLDEILLLKKVKDDEVTKFALQHPDLASILQNTSITDHEHVCASLAVHPDVQKRVEHIRKSIPAWETTLPTILKTLGTRSTLKKWRKINKGIPNKPNKELKKNLSNKQEDKVDLSSQITHEKEAVRKDVSFDKSETSKDVVPNNITIKEPEEKVNDPFFIAKKVTIPKLLLSEVLENPEEELKFSRDVIKPSWRRVVTHTDKGQSIFPKQRAKLPHLASSKIEHEAKEDEVKLHPSWAAKKVKHILPFQGKKIKFE